VKACKDCIWCRSTLVSWKIGLLHVLCLHKDAIAKRVRKIDYYQGSEVGTIYFRTIEEERTSNGTCGPDAKNFQQRDQSGPLKKLLKRFWEDVMDFLRRKK
jgi:hypothetical protein